MDNKYKYTYEKKEEYCYEGTDTLINKLNIINDDDLYMAERELVSLRILELNEVPIKGDFDFEHLKSIHKYLFQDIYEWAGNIRKCNIAKKDLFCLVQYIDNYSNEIFNKIKKEKYFLEYDYEIKLNKLIELFADINALHPFREGNGRCQRIFIESLAKINGIYLDLTNVSKIDMIIASHESINGHNKKLKEMFSQNSYILTDKDRMEYVNIYCSDNLKLLIKRENKGN